LVNRPVKLQTLILKTHSKRYKTMNTAIMRAFGDSIYYLFPSWADRIHRNTSGSYMLSEGWICKTVSFVPYKCT
jgi:hypothetical protein